VERTGNRVGSVSLGQHIVLAAEILAGRRVGVRIEPATLMLYATTSTAASCCASGTNPLVWTFGLAERF
jgi:hypothetical protein